MRAIMLTMAAGVLALGVVLGTVGCGGASGPRGGTLEGVTWLLSSYSEGGSMKSVPKSPSVELGFKADVASGRAVNTYNGPYSATPEGKIKIGPLASTLMAGPPEAMAVEQAYFKALEKAASYYSDGSALTLYDQGGTAILAFKKSDVTLTGRTWVATGINNGKEAVVGTVSTGKSTAEFLTDGSMRGSGGVNSYSAPYKTAGEDGIEIGAPISTKMAGPPELMKQEAEFFAALQTAKKYVLRGGSLELRTATDALAVSFAASSTP
jgi:heat shock protein HslJ